MQCNNTSNNVSLPSVINQTNCSTGTPSYLDCETATKTENLIVVIYLALVLCLTIFGNFLVIAVVIAYERLQGVTNFFIVSLAVADLLTGALSHPFNIYQTLHNQIWCSNLTTCHLFLIMDVIVNSASIFNLAAVSFDRLVAITMPFKYSNIISKRNAFLIITAVWAYSIFWGFIMLHNFTSPGDVHIEITRGNGSSDAVRLPCYNKDTVFFTCSAVLTFFVPLVIIIVAYSFIFKTAITQAKAVAALDPNRNQQKRTLFFREVKATKIIAMVIGAFVIAWLPVFIVLLVAQWDNKTYTKFTTDHPEAYKAIYYTFLRILPPLNSCINPIIYGFFNSSFRSAFIKFLHLPRRLPREMDHSMVTTATTYPERPYTTVNGGDNTPPN